MTWTRNGDEFAEECARARLSDAAYRTHSEGLIYVMKRELDGAAIDDIAIRYHLNSPDRESAIKELVAAGFWTDEGDGTYRVVHHVDVQEELEVIRARRVTSRERSRRYRRKAAGLSSNADGDASRNADGDASRNACRPGLVRSGQDRTGLEDQSVLPREAPRADPGQVAAWLEPQPKATEEQFTNGIASVRAVLETKGIIADEAEATDG
jgi:hypothetical protein